MSLLHYVEELASLGCKCPNLAICPPSNYTFAIRRELNAGGVSFLIIFRFQFDLKQLRLSLHIEDLYLIETKTSKNWAIIVGEDYFTDFTMERSHEASLILKWSFFGKSAV